MKDRRQTSYKERGQIEGRIRLGELEKKKDFQKRREAEKKREEAVKRIQKEIDEKNPDEFHFFMYSAEKRGAKIFSIPREKEGAGEREREPEAKRGKRENLPLKVALCGNGSRIVFVD
jgi:U3 small nucleolar RNA-associated protein 11